MTSQATYNAIAGNGCERELTATEIFTNCQSGAILGFAEPDDQAYFAQPYVARCPELFERQMIERAIVRQVVRDVLNAPEGYAISIHDGEGFAIRRSRDVEAVMRHIMSTDEDRLIVYAPGEDASKPWGNADGWRRIGTLLLVYGNDGWDVMADSSEAPEFTALLERAEALADELSELVARDSAATVNLQGS